MLSCFFLLGTTAALMNTADIAILLTSGVSSDNFCGAAYTRPLIYNSDTIPPIGWVGKDCTDTLAHELGHILGARHNYEISKKTFEDDTFGFGYLIPNRGAGTIMAYRTNVYPKRYKAFSSPLLRFGNTNTYIGTATRADARRSIMMNR